MTIGELTEGNLSCLSLQQLVVWDFFCSPEARDRKFADKSNPTKQIQLVWNSMCFLVQPILLKFYCKKQRTKKKKQKKNNAALSDTVSKFDGTIVQHT